MTSPLTIQMVINNNEETIESALDSIIGLKAEILVGDLGCKDNSIEICRKHGVKIVKLSLNDDLSQVRNRLMKEASQPWNFYIEPWETLMSGHESIQNVILGSPSAYKTVAIQGDVITKQTRLWHKDMNLKFTNPVYETLSDVGKELPVYIAIGPNNRSDLYLELVNKWRTKFPLATEPIYYTACAMLGNKQWDTFLNFANLYLHQEKTDAMSVFMTHYYCAMVNCYIKNDYQSAVKSLLFCLSKKPLMSEFWCLLADVYYAIKDYDRAKVFYDNAIVLGGRRLKDDGWPVEISKYKEYPEKMKLACESIKQSLRIYAVGELQGNPLPESFP